MSQSRVDFEREIEWLRAKRDEVWQRGALLERVAGGPHHDEDGDEHYGDGDDHYGAGDDDDHYRH